MDRATLSLGLSVGIAYALNYFWRVSVFMLPTEILEAPVITVYGKSLNVQVCFSMAMTLGFGFSKIFAVRVMTSKFFFAHRFGCLLILFIIPMLLTGVGIWSFVSNPLYQVISYFLSCFFQAWVYGGLLTYLEGRNNTETLLAVQTAAYIFAGNLARGCASLMVTRVSPELMPLLLGSSACVVGCGLLVIADKQPPPSSADIKTRSKRVDMTLTQQALFIKEYYVLIIFTILSFALTSGLRSFRDFFTQEIFAAALGGSQADVPPWLYFVVDIPGAVLTCVLMAGVNKITDHQIALKQIVLLQVFGILVVLGSTAMFSFSLIGGIVWQMTLGTGIYIVYGISLTPFYDRLFAATHTQGTITGLLYLSSFCGYLTTIGLLFYQTFAAPEPSELEAELLLEHTTISTQQTFGFNNNTSSSSSESSSDEVLALYFKMLWYGGTVILLASVVVYVRLVMREPLSQYKHNVNTNYNALKVP